MSWTEQQTWSNSDEFIKETNPTKIRDSSLLVRRQLQHASLAIVGGAAATAAAFWPVIAVWAYLCSIPLTNITAFITVWTWPWLGCWPPPPPEGAVLGLLPPTLHSLLWFSCLPVRLVEKTRSFHATFDTRAQHCCLYFSPVTQGRVDRQKTQKHTWASGELGWFVLIWFCEFQVWCLSLRIELLILVLSLTHLLLTCVLVCVFSSISDQQYIHAAPSSVVDSTGLYLIKMQVVYEMLVRLDLSAVSLFFFSFKSGLFILSLCSSAAVTRENEMRSLNKYL